VAAGGGGGSPVWAGVENRKSLALADVRDPSHPDSSESLCCLRYLGSNSEDGGSKFIRNVDNQYESTRSCNNRDDLKKNLLL